MKWIRTAVVAAVLSGLAAGCSSPSSSRPANAPTEGKHLSTPKPVGGQGAKSRSGDKLND